jgi:putative transposase
MEYRRLFIPGGTYFFTQVTYCRRPILSTPEAVELLRSAFRYTIERYPFTIIASVILPDHLHIIWNLPPESSDYSTRWRLVKSQFSRHWHQAASQSTSRQRHGEVDIWQRRFWEHLIRDETDLSNHVDYIHYNPVKHGLVSSPAEWKYSSFLKFVQDKLYPLDWGGDGNILAGASWLE